MSGFDSAIEHVRSEEGGYVDNPLDPGGRTNFGITQRLLVRVRSSYPGLKLPLDVADLTWLQARDVYRVEFWKPLRGDELPAYIALSLLDAAVNSGAARAVKWLQLALRVDASGSMDARTLMQLRAAKPVELLNEFSARRAHHYMLQDSTDDTFGLGWARRLFRTYSASRGVIT